MDPYKVLDISPNATDDEVKSAYRELARKYHPDNYINNPLADLAQEKMQQVNEAYDAIMKERKSGGSANSGGYQSGGYQGGYQSGGYGYAGQSAGYRGANASIYNQVRNSINVGNIGMAEELLNRVSDRDAEWHFLRSNICYRKGWFDEASQEINLACGMEPNNFEYQRMKQVLNQSAQYGGYRPMQNNDAMDCCTQLLCLNCLCDCMGSGC
ncbi:MAG: J domain-containing protein [Eubacteriales bacterium]|nr:J domain-containing protein [Eubacteriales bacterium]